TLAYLVSALPIAMQRKRKLVISTATVALQEQILNKDLPNLKDSITLPFSYTLAKGRGRYLCLTKLDKKLKHLDGVISTMDDMFNQSPEAQEKEQLVDLQMQYGSHRWQGDKDSLTTDISDEQWAGLTATHRECSNRRCPYYDNCAFYRARATMEDADVIVANHDLVLADLALGGGVVLPAPEKTIYVFDEGHHLAAKALGHFRFDMGMKAQKNWLQDFEKALGSLFKDSGIPAVLASAYANVTDQIKQTQGQLGLITPLLEDLILREPQYRFPQGVVPPELLTSLQNLKILLNPILQLLEGLNELLQKSLDSKIPGEFPLDVAENWQAPMGLFLQKAEQMSEALTWLCAVEKEGDIPVARWISQDTNKDNTELYLSASPISVAGQLRQNLWKRCYGAVVTSATLKALNSFNKLIYETGLPDWASFITVASPFNYAALGELELVSLKSEPNQPDFQLDVQDWLEKNVQINQGTLVLFSSKLQLESTRDYFLKEWKDLLFCQGFLSKAEIVRRHKERIDGAQGSVIFGLASFAEGIDLPGDYVKHVVVVKIPFAVPDDPILEATSEWIESKGRNSFMELSLPAASVRLIQACGRLIRTEQDTGRVSILDKRLVTKRYGQQLVNSLPAFRRI
ncbi:MAG: ATP-dependent DNA helicase DinG, partial [Venatoribacter sp.]